MQPRDRKVVRALAASLLVAACGTFSGAEGPSPDGRAAIDVTTSGGLAALQFHARIDSTSGAFSYTYGPICMSAPCRAMESASGSLTRAEVDSFFARARQPEFRALRTDYGTTPNSADLRLTTLRLYASGVLRTIRADDGTMPTLLAHYLHDVELAVRARPQGSR